jgi:predicted ABC-type ATPase
MAARPSVVILAGHNGAGKSTAAPLLLGEARLHAQVFVNADEIAAERSPADPAGAAITAGREMLSRLHALAQHRQSFAFETPLASRHFAPWLAGLVETGYSVDILFLWLPTADLAVARVRSRVMVGGHDVSEAVVRRRYRRGLRNFFELYQPLATTWQMSDSSVGGAPRLIVIGSTGLVGPVSDPATWAEIQRGVYGRSG